MATLSSQLAAPAPQRNAPCPCGSGLRYKHCHGRTESAASAPPRSTAPYVGWDVLPATDQAALWDTMQEALAAQKAGQLDAAAHRYEHVLARAPLTFDALHMLGVVRFHQGDLDLAEALLTRALELMPAYEPVRHNLGLLRSRKRDHEGLYSASVIVAVDMLRLLGHAGRLTATQAMTGFADLCTPGSAAPLHIIVPGDVANAACNRNGAALLESLAGAGTGTLWTDPGDNVPMVDMPSAKAIDLAQGNVPRHGTACIFGVGSRTLTWLPEVADTFDAIVLALDAHEPSSYVEAIDRLPDRTRARLRVVARSAALLTDLGLPGAVDTMLFLPHVEHRARAARPTRRQRIGVFIPPIRDREDATRWGLLEWLRSQGVFLRLLYPGRLPSRHTEDEDEHLVSLVTDWQDWWRDLDALFFWGAEGRMRQYDRLVFEAHAAGLAVVADGFGDYGEALATADACELFFTVDEARDAMVALMTRAGRHAGEVMLP